MKCPICDGPTIEDGDPEDFVVRCPSRHYVMAFAHGATQEHYDLHGDGHFTLQMPSWHGDSDHEMRLKNLVTDTFVAYCRDVRRRIDAEAGAGRDRADAGGEPPALEDRRG